MWNRFFKPKGIENSSESLSKAQDKLQPTLKESENISEPLIQNIMKDYLESNYYFINLIIKWKKHFMIITAVSIVLSIVFSSSFFIKPVYKSFALVYPSNIIPYSDESPS